MFLEKAFIKKSSFSLFTLRCKKYKKGKTNSFSLTNKVKLVLFELYLKQFYYFLRYSRLLICFLYFLHLKVNRLKLDFLINAFSINIRAYEILVNILQYLARFVLKYK